MLDGFFYILRHRHKFKKMWARELTTAIDACRSTKQIVSQCPFFFSLFQVRQTQQRKKNTLVDWFLTRWRCLEEKKTLQQQQQQWQPCTYFLLPEENISTCSLQSSQERHLCKDQGNHNSQTILACSELTS